MNPLIKSYPSIRYSLLFVYPFFITQIRLRQQLFRWTGRRTLIHLFFSFRRKVPHCCAKKRRTLQCLLIVIAICAIMNAATIVSIGYHISVRQETLIDIFNNSMHLYASTASHKYAIDEIQFIFQCCGHSSYADWFLFDWQVNPPFKKGNSKHGIASVNKKYIQIIFKMQCDIRNVIPWSGCGLCLARGNGNSQSDIRRRI